MKIFPTQPPTGLGWGWVELGNIDKLEVVSQSQSLKLTTRSSSEAHLPASKCKIKAAD